MLKSLKKAGLEPVDIDFIVTVSCTGIMIPSVDAYLINNLEMIKYPNLIKTHFQDLPFIGGAIQKGFQISSGTHILMMASDLETDPNDVKKKITSKTKAIIAADIFGYPCDMDALKKIVGKRKIKIITDSAQAPYSFYKGRLTGTLSDIGGFSLNFHKIIYLHSVLYKKNKLTQASL